MVGVPSTWHGSGSLSLTIVRGFSFQYRQACTGLPWFWHNIGSLTTLLYQFFPSLVVTLQTGESNRATIVEENLIGCWESSAANQIFSAIVVPNLIIIFPLQWPFSSIVTQLLHSNPKNNYKFFKIKPCMYAFVTLWQLIDHKRLLCYILTGLNFSKVILSSFHIHYYVKHSAINKLICLNFSSLIMPYSIKLNVFLNPQVKYHELVWKTDTVINMKKFFTNY